MASLPVTDGAHQSWPGREKAPFCCFPMCTKAKQTAIRIIPLEKFFYLKNTIIVLCSLNIITSH